MEDKQGMTKAVAGVMTDALADGRKPATASNLPPLSNRGGQKPKRQAGFRKSSNVTKCT
ncbi:putative phage protein [Neisseria meningitidis NM422]|nr:putative phage protein [Neisseria meningitidis NM422]